MRLHGAPALQAERLGQELALDLGSQDLVALHAAGLGEVEQQLVVKPDGTTVPFDVQPFRKYCLLGGFDDIGLTLRHADKIRAFEAERLLTKPWLAHTI